MNISCKYFKLIGSSSYMNNLRRGNIASTIWLTKSKSCVAKVSGYQALQIYSRFLAGRGENSIIVRFSLG